MTWALLIESLRGAAKAAMRAPEWLKGIVVFTLIAGAGWWLHRRSVELAVLEDRRVQATAAKQVRDSLVGVITTERINVKFAQAETRAAWAARDSAVRRTQQAERQLASSQQRLADALVKLPSDVRALPPVDTLVKACTALAHDCEQLRVTVVIERAAADSARAASDREARARQLLQAASDSALRASSAMIVHQRLQLAAQDGKISKRTAVAWYVIARGVEWLAADAWRQRHP